MAQPFPSVRATIVSVAAVPVTNVASDALTSSQARIQFSIAYPLTATGILYVVFGDAETASSTNYSYYLNPGDLLVSDEGEWFGNVSVIATVAGPEDIYVTEYS